MSNEDASCVADRQVQIQDIFWTQIDRQVRSSVAKLLEEVMQWKITDQLSADWNQRTGSRRGYRNGCYSRKLVTPYGSLKVRVPRCRSGGLDCREIFGRYQRRVRDVDRILRHAYLLGASTRGTAELAEQIFGASVSHQTISRLTRWLDEQLALWRSMPIEPVYRVVYIDGMHVDVVGGDRMVMLVTGARFDGGTDVLGFSVSVGERCVELLRDLRSRGLEGVEMFVSDESGPIRHALEEVYPEVPWQNCTFHRLQALRTNIGSTNFRNQMTAEASNIFRCPSMPAAREAATAWAKRWKQSAPWAVQRFMDGLSDSLTFYMLPETWWRRTRTNNPLERQISTLRMRLNSMGCFYDHPAIERAVFGQLLRWHRIKLTHSC
jgi:transposase-like protein